MMRMGEKRMYDKMMICVDGRGRRRNYLGKIKGILNSLRHTRLKR
jgi:hypothetical protein